MIFILGSAARARGGKAAPAAALNAIDVRNDLLLHGDGLLLAPYKPITSKGAPPGAEEYDGRYRRSGEMTEADKEKVEAAAVAGVGAGVGGAGGATVGVLELAAQGAATGLRPES